MNFATWPPLLVVDVEGNGTNPPDLVEVAALPIRDGRPDKTTAKAWLTRPNRPVTPFATEISSAMISSTQSPTANTGFRESPPSSISYSERSSNGTSAARWWAIRPSVPGSGRKRTDSMADRVVPHFHNTPGVAVIEIGAHEFMCEGEVAPFDHPHVYLDMGDATEIICPYCSTLFRLDPTLDPHAARPAECALADGVTA